MGSHGKCDWFESAVLMGSGSLPMLLPVLLSAAEFAAFEALPVSPEENVQIEKPIANMTVSSPPAIAPMMTLGFVFRSEVGDDDSFVVVCWGLGSCAAGKDDGAAGSAGRSKGELSSGWCCCGTGCCGCAVSISGGKLLRSNSAKFGSA